MFMRKAKKLNLGSVSKPVCPTCGSKGYKTNIMKILIIIASWITTSLITKYKKYIN